MITQMSIAIHVYMHVHTLVYAQDTLTNHGKTISTRHQQLIGVCGGTCAEILFLYMYLCQLFYLLPILFVGTNITFPLDLQLFSFGESPPQFEFIFFLFRLLFVAGRRSCTQEKSGISALARFISDSSRP